MVGFGTFRTTTGTTAYLYCWSFFFNTNVRRLILWATLSLGYRFCLHRFTEFFLIHHLSILIDQVTIVAKIRYKTVLADECNRNPTMNGLFQEYYTTPPENASVICTDATLSDDYYGFLFRGSPYFSGALYSGV